MIRELTTKSSKTRRKRDMKAPQQIGESLIDMPDEQLRELPLPDPLLEAVLDARKIQRRGALHRQRQYIGRLMREIDTDPIRIALEDIRHRERSQVTRFQQAERWRERILEDGDLAIDRFLSNYPDANRKHLRRLMLAARNEANNDLPPRSSRAIFRYIHKHILEVHSNLT